MSSWIVSRRHIDLLVTAILTHAPHALTGTGSAARVGDRLAADADRIGAVLWAANHASVNHRYDEHTPAPPYRHTPTNPTTLQGCRADRPTTARTPTQTPVEGQVGTQAEAERILFLIKQVDCYAYQCADLPTWADHPAQAWTTALRDHLTQRLHTLCPDVDARGTHTYQATPWGIR